MKLLSVYLIDDVVYNIYLLVTVLLPCLIYQGVMKTKAKSNMKKMPAKYYVGVYAFSGVLVGSLQSNRNWSAGGYYKTGDPRWS